jgi:hypothetical protein
MKGGDSKSNSTETFYECLKGKEDAPYKDNLFLRDWLKKRAESIANENNLTICSIFRFDRQ